MTTTNVNHVKALAHPLRVDILRRLGERTASPSELADELKVPLPNLSYHVRMLLELELIKLKRTRPRRGAIEHYYAATPTAAEALAAAGLLGQASPLELVRQAKAMAQRALDLYPDLDGYGDLEAATAGLGLVELELERATENTREAEEAVNA